MRSTFLSLMAAAHAVLVTETDYATFYVTVGPDGQPESTSTSISTNPPSVPTSSAYPTISVESTSSSSSSSAAEAANYLYTSSASTTESPSTSSSSSATPTPSSTSVSTSLPPPPPPATSSSSVYVPPTTSASSTSAPSPTLDGFQSDIINYHNRVRAIHHVGDLVWNDTLSDYAQQYLNNDNCVFQHSGGPYGENIAIGYPTIDDAQDAWYNEEDNYNYTAGQFGEDTGHFTQMLWKATTSIGCATVDCLGSTFLACEYWPRGNVIGEFTENVFAP